MHYPTYEQLTTAHKAAGGIWDTTKVFTMHQLQDKLADAQDSANTEEIETVVGSLSWLSEAATGSRKRYLFKSLRPMRR